VEFPQHKARHLEQAVPSVSRVERGSGVSIGLERQATLQRLVALQDK
jgi:hypothetical protein